MSVSREPKESETLKGLEEFDVELAKVHMRGQWQVDKLLQQAIQGPKPAGIPYLWKWTDIEANLRIACEKMPETFGVRRNISFVNPGLGSGRGVTTQTITMGMQTVRSGESASAHRHTIAALRFVIQGSGDVFTVVNGQSCPMENYDLILTPSWSWHDHHNESGEPAIWVDVLDSPFIFALNQTFFEPYAEDTQPVRSQEADILQERVHLVRPTWKRQHTDQFPFRYPWREVELGLKKLAGSDGSPYDGVALEYVNPVTGGSALSSLGCWIQLLRPGQETKPHRHTSSSVYCVVRGEGTTIAGDQELHWSQHDSFAIPNWIQHQHINRSKSDEAILFSVNDIPILEVFGLYREEPEISLQTVERWG